VGRAGTVLDEAHTTRTAEWHLRSRRLRLDRPVVVGILNVTPDSFSDGGVFLEPELAIAQAHAMVEDGADMIDVGAESSRPGAQALPVETEWSRLEPVMAGLRDLPIPVSVDTTKEEIARRSLELGADAINDISGLRFEPRIADLAADTGAGLVLMHMRGDPRTMQTDVEYEDLLTEVGEALTESAAVAVARGCRKGQIVVDPGVGFGKSAEGSLELIARLDALAGVGYPILVGPSRKSFLGVLFGYAVEERLEGTLTACVAALARGARLFRVHDVRAARRTLDVAHAIEQIAR
jgi:dihydropteroate synthase